jgi:hypothetical protein
MTTTTPPLGSISRDEPFEMNDFPVHMVSISSCRFIVPAASVMTCAWIDHRTNST